MNLGKFLIQVIVLMSFGVSAVAQSNDISQYLDDGNISESQNLVTINLVSPLTGDFSAYFERVFFQRFALEIGGGIVAPFYFFELPNLNDNHNMQLVGIGYSFHLSPKLYFSDEAPEYHFIGPYWRVRNYIPEVGPKLTFHDFSINYGYHLFTWKNAMFGVNAGVGYRFWATENQGKKVLRLENIVVPYNFRFGFRF